MLLCLGSVIAALSVRVARTAGARGAPWLCTAQGGAARLREHCCAFLLSALRSSGLKKSNFSPFLLGIWENHLSSSSQRFQQTRLIPDPSLRTPPGCCWTGAGGSCRAGGETSAEPQRGFWVSLAHSSPACVGSKHPAGRHGQLPAARSAWEGSHGFLHAHLENNFHGCSQKQILLCRQGPGCSLLQLFVCFPSSLLILPLVSFPLYPSPLSPLGVFDLPPLSFCSVSPCDPAPTLARRPAMPS